MRFYGRVSSSDKVFSSIDQFGRYAFANQPAVIK